MGKGKKKRSQHTKAAKRRTAKRKARREAIRQKVSPPQGQPGLRAFIQDGRLDRWLAHGANFLGSNYDEGEWSPLFDEVYRGESVPAEAIQRKVLKHFWLSEEDTLSDQGTLVGAWATLRPAVAYHFYRRALDHLAESGEENPEDASWKPHQGVVWKYLHELGLELLT